MLDPALLRKELSHVVERLARRGVAFDTERYHSLEAQRKAVQVETETLQSQRNALAKQIGQCKARGADASSLLAQSQAIPERLKELSDTLATAVSIKLGARNKGQLIVDFANLDALDGIIARLRGGE